MGARPTCVDFITRGRPNIHHWPSNFFIEADGSHVEGELQAAKHKYNAWLALFLRTTTPWKAKQYGRSWRLSHSQIEEWNRRKRDELLALLAQKVYDNPELYDLLMETGDGPITEVNWWHDNEWGDCSCMKCYRVGKNMLGYAWEDLRERLRAG